MAAFPHPRFVAVRQAHDKIVDLCGFSGRGDLLNGGVRHTISNVIPDCGGKKENVLLGGADVFTQRGEGNIPDVDAVHGDAAAGHIVEPEDEVDNCALATAGSPDQRHQLPRFDTEINRMQRRCIFRIAEADIFERHFAFQFIQNNCIRFIFDLGFGIEDFKNTFTGRHRAGIHVGDHPQCSNGHGEHTEIHDELDYAANGQIAGDHLASAVPQYQRHQGADEKNHQRGVKSHDVCRIDLLVEKLFGESFREFFTLSLFLGETLHDSDAGQTLLESRTEGGAISCCTFSQTGLKWRLVTTAR